MRSLIALVTLPLALAAPLAQEKYIVVMKPGASTGGSEHIAAGLGSSSADSMLRGINTKHQYSSGSFKGFAASLTQPQVDTLKNNPNVAYVERDGVLHTQGQLTKRLETKETNATWGLGRISHKTKGSTEYLYDSSAGEGTCAYVIDTGIFIAHPEFEGRATFVKNFDTVDGNDNDMYGHGTHVAGTIGSKTYGVAKKTSLFAMKVCNQYGSCELSDVIAAIALTVTDSKTRNCPKGVVINMSLGAPNSEWQSIKDSIKAATDAGVFVSVAAGNNGLDAKDYSPASAPEACAVGAVDANDQIASFSNYGANVAVFAPGVNVLSTYNAGPSSTTLMDGTSMASPHIAGLGAYLMGLKGKQAPAALCNLIKSTATTGAIKGIPGVDTQNRIAFNGAS